MILQLKDFGKQTMTLLASKAKRLGMTPQGYIRSLVEDDLALESAVRTRNLRDIVGAGRKVDERELDSLVDKIREEHHGRPARKTKRKITRKRKR